MEEKDLRVGILFEERSGYKWYDCDLRFEKDIPYAVWRIKHGKSAWVKLEKEFLEKWNTVVKGEMIHYRYNKPIKLNDPPA